MTVYLLNSDARNIPLADQSVQCVVTSPPYWGLRDYGTAQWMGGDEACSHAPSDTPSTRGILSSTLGGWKSTTGHQKEGYKAQCQRCGAVRIDKQIGLERTPQAYVASIVQVMSEVWRVLRDDGVLWMNLGDSYASIGHKKSNSGYGTTGLAGGIAQEHSPLRHENNGDGLKHKDLVGIPWRVAFALQDAGWYLRSDIIWSKPNPMPESVTDRPTKAHEYIFLLAKSERYYYDADSIAEPLVTGDNGSSFTNERDLHLHPNTGRAPRKHDGATTGGNGSKIKDHVGNSLNRPDGKRNKRTIWTVATTPYGGAHFATFPPKLVEPMILAGSRPGDVVLDPFSGSGTVGRVCAKHGRSYVGLDLNLSYIDLAYERTSKVQTAMQGI